MLEAILEIPIEKVTVKNPELVPDLYDIKAGILDIKVQINSNIICDIEMQVQNQKNMDSRSTFYMSRILSDEMKKKEDYQKIKDTIVINLMNFEFYKRNSYHNIAHMKFEETKENEYVELGYKKEDEIASKDLEMHFIEIPKFEKKNPEAKTKLEQWLWLIAGREDKLEMAKKENKEIKKAIDIIDQMSMDEKEWELYNSRQMAIMDYNTGMLNARDEGEAIGLSKGKKEEQLRIAKNFLKLGIDVEDIKKATGLTRRRNRKNPKRNKA